VDAGFGRAWSYLGMTHKEMNNHEEAIRAFTRSLELDPAGYPWDYTNLGNLLTEVGRYPEAIKTLDHALTMLPGDSWTYTSQGRAFAEMGDKPAAIAALQEAIELDPLDPRPQVLLDELRGE
jgi:tetratricopeptide (TPR) repeat protein